MQATDDKKLKISSNSEGLKVRFTVIFTEPIKLIDSRNEINLYIYGDCLMMKILIIQLQNNFWRKLQKQIHSIMMNIAVFF